MNAPRRQISPGRKALYYAGMALTAIGLLLFVSTFITAALNFGNFENFNDRMRSQGLRAAIGMVLMVVGGIMRSIGAKGPAGSGVVLDPEAARRDIEPWSRMAGGVVNDALSEVELAKKAETTGPEASREQRVNEVIAAYLQAVDAGQAPDRQELLARYPNLAAELAAFFEDHNRVGQWSGLLEPTGPEQQPGGEVEIPATGATGPEFAASEIATDLTNASRETQRYRILQPHAQGGLGMVSIAEDLELPRRVALKEIQPRHAHDPQSRTRFLREAEITGYLEHPGIVPIYSLARYADGRPFYAMRFIEGESLAQAIQRLHHQPMPRVYPRQRIRSMESLGEALQRFVGLGRKDVDIKDPVEKFNRALRGLLGRFIAACNAVAYAHSRGVLHRDLKPANIMLGAYGETLVIDWGLAKVMDHAGNSEPEGKALQSHADTKEGLTQMGTALGTPAYMSPEQAAGHLDRVNPASDVYSLGATLYTLLTGQPSIQGRNNAEILKKVQQGDWRPPQQIRWQIPAALDAICCKAMALDPARRYDSALELAADVERWLADEPVSAWRETGIQFYLRVFRNQNLLRLAVITFAVLWVGSACAFIILWFSFLTTLIYTQYPVWGVLGSVVGCVLGLIFIRLFGEWNEWNKSQGFKARATNEPPCVPRQTNPAGWLRRTAALYARYLQSFGIDRAGMNQVKGKAYWLLGRICEELRQRRRAVAAYRKALAIQGQLVRDFPDVPSYQTNLTRTRRALALLGSDLDL